MHKLYFFIGGFILFPLAQMIYFMWKEFKER